MYTWILPLHFFFSFPKDPLLWAPPAGWILCWPAYRSIQPLKGGYFFCCCLITVISLSFIHPYSLFIHKLHKYICAILPLPWRRYIHHKKKGEKRIFFTFPILSNFLKVKISLCVLHTGQCCTVPGMLLPRDENECVFFSPKTFFFAIKKKTSHILYRLARLWSSLFL